MNMTYTSIRSASVKSIILSLSSFFLQVFSSSGQTDIHQFLSTGLGISKNTAMKDFKGINVRFISPRFQIDNEDHYWTEEEEKNPELFKKARMMFEFLYAPPFYATDDEGLSGYVRIYLPGDTSPVYLKNTVQLQQFSISGNLQYRVWQFKRLTFEVMGGLKFFVLTSPEYGLINYRKIYYWNAGFLSQLGLGIVNPFISIERGRLYTFGAEIKFKHVYKNQKRIYKLHLRRQPQ